VNVASLDHQDLIRAENFINLIVLLLQIFLIFVFRFYQKKLGKEIRNNHLCVSDYSVKINNLPKNTQLSDLEQFLLDNVNSKIDGHDSFSQLGYPIARIYAIYDYREFQKMQLIKIQLTKMKTKLDKQLEQIKNAELRASDNLGAHEKTQLELIHEDLLKQIEDLQQKILEQKIK